MSEVNDSLDGMERQDTKTKMPLGWVLLAAGLIIWAVFYTVSYTPQISGWTQAGQYQDSLKQQ